MFLYIPNKLLIEFITILAMVYSPVTVRTQSDDITRVIRPAIAPAVEVVNFKKRFTVFPTERSGFFATLTDSISDVQGVLFDDF